MFLRMIYDEKLAQAAYLIGCQRSGEAIVIDPERDVDRYEAIAVANGLRLVAVAETHIHADFLSGARELAEKGALVLLSDEGGPEWKYAWVGGTPGSGAYRHRLLRHGDTFMVGRIEFKAIHTPGHTPEHLCYMVTDRGAGADAPMGVATGDFVFVGDLGRPDLLESAVGDRGSAEVSARALHGSVRTFMEWPDYMQVWPGHGAGSACGKALGAVPQTTVGYEKKFNPAIRGSSDERAFVESMVAGQPEPPLYFSRMKRENKAGPAVLGRVPSPSRIRADQLPPSGDGDVVVIDARPWDAFRSGHAPGALHLPLNNSFTTDAGSLVDEDDAIILLIEPARVNEAVRDLIRIGLDRVVGWADASEFDPDAVGSTPGRVPEVSAEQAAVMIGDRSPFVLDVRRGSEFAEGRIPGALNIAHTRLRSRLTEIPANRPILVNCRSGARSARACSLLLRHGFDAINLSGGFLAWEKSGMPVER